MAKSAFKISEFRKETAARTAYRQEHCSFPTPIVITTDHPDIGYTNNIEIIERALREQAGFDDNSYVMRAVAAHIWSMINTNTDRKATWGEKEIAAALAGVANRVAAMHKHFATGMKGIQS